MRKSRFNNFSVETKKYDKWNETCNPDNPFPVNLYASEYLDILHKEWREEYDPFDEYLGLDPSDFNTETEYKEALEERMIWKDDYDPYNQFDEINPSDYNSEIVYANDIKDKLLIKENKNLDCAFLNNDFTLFPNFLYDQFFDHQFISFGGNFSDYKNNNKSKALWKVEFDPENACDTSPFDYYTKRDYFVALQKEKDEKYYTIRLEVKYNPNHEYDINPDDFDDEFKYLDALRVEWKKDLDPNNQYPNVNPFDYDRKRFYLSVLRVEWKKDLDPSNQYPSIGPFEYDTKSLYLNALRQKWKKDLDSNNQYPGIDPFEYDTKSLYFSAIRKQWKKDLDSNDGYSSIKPYIFDTREGYSETIYTKREYANFYYTNEPLYIIDNNKFSIKFNGIRKILISSNNSSWFIDFVIDNKSSYPIRLSLSDVFVNEYEIKLKNNTCPVYGGKTVFTDVVSLFKIDDKRIEKLDIKKIEQLIFTINIEEPTISQDNIFEERIFLKFT